MDQNSNPNDPDGNVTPPQNAGGPPPVPSYNDPETPKYGDPETPSPAAPPPPPPGPNPAVSSPPPPPNYESSPGAGTLTNPSKDDKNWAMFAHLSGLVAGFILSFTTIPALGFIGPMVIYLMKKDESPFIADQAKEALNFSISIGIIMLILWVLSWTVILIIITIPLMLITGVTALVFVIIAAIKSSQGELYRYPFTLRLVK